MCNLSSAAFDRLRRYKNTLWRQILKINLLLNEMPGERCVFPLPAILRNEANRMPMIPDGLAPDWLRFIKSSAKPKLQAP